MREQSINYCVKAEFFFCEIGRPCEQVADLNSQDNIDSDISEKELRDEVILF